MGLVLWAILILVLGNIRYLSIIVQRTESMRYASV